jgi:PAT family beta-lactamase induction signal transducer AmpG
MPDPKPPPRNPWTWIPTLYLAQGLPFAVVNTMSVIMYKSLGVSNTDIAFYTAWLYLPWVIKPLWSPVVDILKTRRQWIWATQLLLGAGFAAVGLSLSLSMFFKATLVFFYLVAFSSATHDIAADGFYMLALNEKQQAFFVGIRSTFFRISMITGQGLLVILAGFIQIHTGLPKVELQVAAKTGAAFVQSVQPESFPVPTGEGELRIIAPATTLEISPQPRTKAEISALIAAAKEANSTNGFIRTRQESKALDKKDAGASWWTRNVSGHLGDFLRQHFGPEIKSKSDFTGNVGVVALSLSKPPGKEIVVTPAFKSGDKSVSLAEGARLVFDDRNWNKPALAVLQLDPKLKSETTARFEVRSGNIQLSWAVTFLVLVGLFLAFGIYHRFVLPCPASDLPGSTSTVVHFIKEFFLTFGSFFTKPRIGVLLLFLLLYRFGEAQLVKMVAPFLLDGREVGGLGLTTGQVGLVYGTIGIIALT